MHRQNTPIVRFQVVSMMMQLISNNLAPEAKTRLLLVAILKGLVRPQRLLKP